MPDLHRDGESGSTRHGGRPGWPFAERISRFSHRPPSGPRIAAGVRSGTVPAMQGTGGPTNCTYNHFVAPNYSELTECRAKPVGDRFPDRAGWLNGLVLRALFQAAPPKSDVAFALAVLRRAEGAVEDYDTGCAALDSFVTANRSTSVYFRALREFESAIAQVYQAFEFLRKKPDARLFKPGDGSVWERLNMIYNSGRHGDPRALPPGVVQLVWMENDGVHAQPEARSSATVSFDELRKVIEDLAKGAEIISAGGLWSRDAWDPTLLARIESSA